MIIHLVFIRFPCSVAVAVVVENDHSKSEHGIEAVTTDIKVQFPAVRSVRHCTAEPDCRT